MAQHAPDRLATIAAAVLVSADLPADRDARKTRSAAAISRTAQRLAVLFEDLIWVGEAPPVGSPGRRVEATEGPGPLGWLASALCAAESERVLAMSDDVPEPSVDLCLALVAWPEADVVAPRAPGGGMLFGLYRRTPTLDCARRLLAEGRSDTAELHDALGCEYLEAEDLARVDSEATAMAGGGAG